METNTQKKFELDDCYHSFSQKLISSIIHTVETMNKKTNIMNINGFEDKFIVRNGTYYSDLEKEEQENKIIGLGYITLKMIGHPQKKARFSVWKKLQISQILN